ncbi:MAG: hypothetical protein ACYDAJ_00955 [Nitrosotalea sp.]
MKIQNLLAHISSYFKTPKGNNTNVSWIFHQTRLESHPSGGVIVLVFFQNILPVFIGSSGFGVSLFCSYWWISSGIVCWMYLQKDS